MNARLPSLLLVPAFLIGGALGWSFMPAGENIIQAATSPHNTQASASRAGEGETIKRAVPKMDDLFEDLADQWDEGAAVDRLADLPTDDLVTFIHKADALKNYIGLQLGVAAREALARRDFPLALKLARESAVPQDGDAAIAIGCLLGWRALTDPAAALAHARVIDPGENETIIDGVLFYRWIKDDLDGVLNYWDKHPDTGNGVASLAAYLRERSQSELLALAPRLAKLKRTDLRNNALAALTDRLSQMDPNAAFHLSLSLLSSDQEKSLDAVNDTLRDWAEASPKDFIEGLKSLPADLPPEARAQIISEAMQALGKQPAGLILLQQLESALLPADPAATTPSTQHSVSRLLDLVPDPNRRSSIVGNLVKDLQTRGFMPQAASLAELQPARERGHAYLDIAHLWQHRDPEAAQAWASALPDANDREHALAGIAEALGNLDPHRAIPLFNTLQQPAMRQHVMRSLAEVWLPLDSGGYSAWLDSLPEMNRVLKAELMGE